MRSEQKMTDLILGVAREEERVRAVYLNGSRANPSVPRDRMQDYDVVYVVTETVSFRRDPGWIDVFGERLMLQLPCQLDFDRGEEMDLAREYNYLMLFRDGNRIDLTLLTVEAMRVEIFRDLPAVPLLDKDGCLPPLPPPSDRRYWERPPEAPAFASCCSNFWWCQNNVAKGIWRGELPYARRMFDQVVRDQLDEMVRWWLGMGLNYGISAGKLGKFFPRLLPDWAWQLYRATYAGPEDRELWDALAAAGELFHRLGVQVAEYFGFAYPQKEEDGIRTYLRWVRELPKER